LVYKNILAASTLVVMAACGGSTLKINLNPGNLPGLTPLGIGDAVTANSDAEVVALNYNTAAVGATVTASEFGGVSDAIVTIVNSVAGNAAYTVFGVDNSSTIRSTTVGPNLNLLTQAATDVKNAAFGSVQSDVSTIGGQTVTKTGYIKTAGSSEVVENTIGIGDIVGYHLDSKIGDANTFAVGTARTGTATRETATGDFSYQGMAIIDMANDVSYDSQTATMTVNFETLSGEFTANNFTNDDEPAMNISMTNAVTLNNADGTISGSGTITVNGATGNMGLVGIMASDNSAVAGGFITNNPTEVGGAESGIFALPVVP